MLSKKIAIIYIVLANTVLAFFYLFGPTILQLHSPLESRSKTKDDTTTALYRHVTTTQGIPDNVVDKVKGNPASIQKPSSRKALGWRNKFHWESKIDQHDYRVLINPRNKCKQSENITLLILVKTRVSSIRERNIIRETYGQGIVKYNVSATILFLLGRESTHTSSAQVDLQKEADLHGDILQEDFIDTYYNLTIKLIMGFKWASTSCSNAYFVMSTDDDCIVDVVNLVNDLESTTSPTFLSKFALAERAINWVPHRDPGDKWYTPREFYSADRWLPFPRGYGYVVSREVAHLLYQASQKIAPPAPWDDVYCGILLHSLGIEMQDIKVWFKTKRAHAPSRAPLKVQDHYVIGGNGNAMNMMNAWKAVENRYQK
ncbi:beta-1,3-galactosyltransferase 5-like [Lytechinus variegatus]|uniref:beta-1,3-galactosyltransferase 5-like n=1 Tax=Lytechinus variegatus TaxID=7654 RepID=UPI001BB20560|nr:beta-1,3-galactosyltransferase 5-like [Lytechinus variegatus]